MLACTTDWLRALHIVTIFVLGPLDKAINTWNINSHLLTEEKNEAKLQKVTHNISSHILLAKAGRMTKISFNRAKNNPHMGRGYGYW